VLQPLCYPLLECTDRMHSVSEGRKEGKRGNGTNSPVIAVSSRVGPTVLLSVQSCESSIPRSVAQINQYTSSILFKLNIAYLENMEFLVKYWSI